MANATGILAAFNPKAPVEPTAPTPSQDNFGEGDNFKDYLKDAVQSQPEKDSQYNDSDRSAQNETRFERKVNDSRDKNQYSSNENKEVNKTTQSRESADNVNNSLSDEEALVKDLEALGLSREQIDALLEAINSGDTSQAFQFIQNLAAPELGGLDAESLSHDNAQLSSMMDRWQKQKEQVMDSIGKLDANRQEQIKLTKADANAQSSMQEAEDDSKPDFFTQLGLKSDKAETVKSEDIKAKRSDVQAKQQEVAKNELTPRITVSSETGEKKSSQDQLNREPLIDLKIQGSQFSSSQSRDGTVGLKGPEGMKATLEAPPTVIQANVETSSKAAEGVKSFVSETFSGRGPAETKIINQIVEKFSIRSAGDQNNIKLRLDPPSLGSVRMNISTVGDSVRTTIVVENQAVKQAIENNISQLRDSMHSQGLEAEQINVTVGGEGSNDRSNNDSLAKRESNSQASFESFLGNEAQEHSATPFDNPVLTHSFEDTSLSVLA